MTEKLLIPTCTILKIALENKTADKKIQLKVSESEAGNRLDKYLSEVPDIKTRSRASFLIDRSCVTMGSKVLKASYKVQTGDEIQVTLPTVSKSGILPFDFKLDILFEDSDVIVINKPAGLVVHPAAGHEQDTLVNALMHHTQDLSMKFGEDRPGIVHRLDKETSGLLVVAKNDFAHESLAAQFKERSTTRRYLALCIGTARNLEGTLQSYLARHHIDRKRYASVRDSARKILTEESNSEVGKWAVTNYNILHRKSGMTYLSLKLETGRTHQIRVHLSESGLPIVGDSLYGADKKINSIEAKQIREDVQNLNRFLLHAAELGFTHPKTLQKMHFQTPWPKEIHQLLQKWGFLG